MRDRVPLGTWHRATSALVGLHLICLGLAGCAVSMPSSSIVNSAAVYGQSKEAPKPAAMASADDRKPASGRQVKVALLLPLSAPGHLAAVATTMKQAAELAIFEAGNPAIQLIVKDTLGTPEGATAAAEDSIKQGVALILGPLTSPAVKAAGAVARKSSIPVIAFSNDASAASPGVFLLSFLVEQEVERIIDFAARKGLRRIAALIPNDTYGKITEQAFRSAVARSAGTIVSVEQYPPDGGRLLEPTQKLSEAMQMAEASGEKTDAVFLPGGPSTLPNLGPLLTHANMNAKSIRLLGTGGWDQVGLGQNQPFVGGWFPAPDPQNWQNFSRRFAKANGISPPRIATLAYDALTVAMQQAARPDGQRFSISSLTDPQGFTGIDGPFRFLSNGLAERNLAILEIQPDAPRMIEPAPASYPAIRSEARSASLGMN